MPHETRLNSRHIFDQTGTWYAGTRKNYKKQNTQNKRLAATTISLIFTIRRVHDTYTQNFETSPAKKKTSFGLRLKPKNKNKKTRTKKKNGRRVGRRSQTRDLKPFGTEKPQPTLDSSRQSPLKSGYKR